ncbi:ABC transporter ATP-binding protein/permease, partial [Pasteurellaceae bacterium UScroc12]
MNLRQELFDSALWLAQAFFGSFLFLIILTMLLIKFSRWGKQFWQLTADYIDLKNNLKAIILFMVIVLLSLMAVRLSVLFSNWYNTMYTALQEMNVNTFWSSIALFTVLASIHIVLSLTNFYLSQRFIIQWRI